MRANLLQPFVAPYTCTFLLCGVAFTAFAEPVPTSTEGDLTEGATLVINGRDFGSKESPAPYIFDTQDRVWINGEASRPYDGLAEGALVPVGDGLPWVRGGKGRVKISREDGYARYFGDFAADQQDAWLEYPAGFPDPGAKQVDEVYIRWWWKATFDVHDNSHSPDGTNTSAKFIRVWDSTGSNSNAIQLSWTQMHLTEGSVYWSPDKTSGPVGQWNLMELYLNVPKGVIQARRNGRLVHDIRNHNWGSNPDGLQPRLWGLDGSGSRNWSGEKVEFSDYYADSTPARVEIGDAPNWSDVRVREPQVPLSWSDDQIRVELYRGLLDRFDGAYLYVIDSDGSVNSKGILLGAPRPKPPTLAAAQ